MKIEKKERYARSYLCDTLWKQIDALMDESELTPLEVVAVLETYKFHIIKKYVYENEGVEG